MHSDYIFKIVFDTYGRRMATCSADRQVKVWDLQDSGEWNLVAQWQAHRGAVTSLAFAHPEYGHLLATCGSDHDVIIWEEKTLTTTTTASTASTPLSPLQQGGSNAGASAIVAPMAGGGIGNAAISTPTPNTTTANTNTTNNNNLPSRWMSRASLTDARRATTCLEFAPRHWGLKLAVGSADGCVRIYEAHDVMNLAQWPLLATLQLSTSSSSNHATSSAGNASSTSTTTSLPPQQVSSLSWCTGRFEPLTLVVAGTNQLVIYRYVEGTAHAWQSILQLDHTSSSGGCSFLNVAWAPNVGRRYHYIAATTNPDGQLKVYKLARTDMMTTTATNSSSSTAAAKKETTSSSSQQQQQQQQQQQTLSTAPSSSSSLAHGLLLEWSQTLEPTHAAWNCQWNVTGTVLASSGDGGVIQLWKADPTAASAGKGQFFCVSTVPATTATTEGNTTPMMAKDGNHAASRMDMTS
ncbi:hypothetical protein ACA910_014936 [Epithemia clementina (nom. ined.)]